MQSAGLIRICCAQHFSSLARTGAMKQSQAGCQGADPSHAIRRVDRGPIIPLKPQYGLNGAPGVRLRICRAQHFSSFARTVP